MKREPCRAAEIVQLQISVQKAGRELELARTQLMAALQHEHESRQERERQEASEWYRRRMQLEHANVSGWKSQRVLLARGVKGVDNQFLCPSGIGKWVRNGPHEPYVRVF